MKGCASQDWATYMLISTKHKIEYYTQRVTKQFRILNLKASKCILCIKAMISSRFIYQANWWVVKDFYWQRVYLVWDQPIHARFHSGSVTFFLFFIFFILHHLSILHTNRNTCQVSILTERQLFSCFYFCYCFNIPPPLWAYIPRELNG